MSLHKKLVQAEEQLATATDKAIAEREAVLHDRLVDMVILTPNHRLRIQRSYTDEEFVERLARCVAEREADGTLAEEGLEADLMLDRSNLYRYLKRIFGCSWRVLRVRLLP